MYALTSAIPLPSAGAIQASLCIPLQGTTSTSRVGSQIKMSRLTARWIIQGTTSALTGDAYNTIRLMVAVVKVTNNQSAATFFTPSYFLQDTSTVNTSMTSQYNWDNRKNFKILYDKLIFVSDPAVAYANGDTNLPFMRKGKVNVKLNRTAQFSANTGGSTDVEKNYLLMFAFSDSAATSHPTLIWQSRVTYRDA